MFSTKNSFCTCQKYVNKRTFEKCKRSNLPFNPWLSSWCLWLSYTNCMVENKLPSYLWWSSLSLEITWNLKPKYLAKYNLPYWHTIFYLNECMRPSDWLKQVLSIFSSSPSRSLNIDHYYSSISLFRKRQYVFSSMFDKIPGSFVCQETIQLNIVQSFYRYTITKCRKHF